MAIKYKATDPATVRQEDRPAQIQRVKEEYEQAKTAGTAAGAKTSAASGSPLNRDVRDAQVRQAWASRPATERFAPTTSATGPAKAVPRATTVQRLNALSNRIGQREQQLTNMGLQLNQLETAYNRGDYSAVDKYNALANQYNTVFNQYVADVDSYNKLYRGEYRDQGIRNNYARSQYGQAVKEARQATRDQGSRQLYQQRQMEEKLRAPQLTTLGKENEQVVERTPNRFERVIGAGLSGTASGFATAGGLVLNNQFDEHDSRTLRRKGASVGAHSQRRISGEEPREAGFTYSVTPDYQQRMARAKLTADGLIDTGRRLNTRSTLQTNIAKEGLGETGQMLVDLGVMAVQMAADIGIAAATGGSMLVPLGIRSYGNGYLTAEQMGFTGDAARSYALGVAAVEVLSEKLFSFFGIVNRYAKGVITQEMSERVIDGLVKRLANTAGGRTALNRLFTILFSAGSEGLEEVVAGVLEPTIRKYTLDRNVKALKEIDWQETLYEGLLGGILGGLGGAVDLTNTRPTYWKYYSQGINESIGRYEEAVKKHGLESKEALQAAKAVWDGGTRKMNAVAGFIVDANEDGTGGKYVAVSKATSETLDKGLPVTYHQLAAAEEAMHYGRTDAEGNPVQGPQIADSLYLGKYLQQEENTRREAVRKTQDEIQRREKARRQEDKALLEGVNPAQAIGAAPAVTPAEQTSRGVTPNEDGTVRLDTASSARAAERASLPTANVAAAGGTSQGAADLSGIPESELTQEEKDELAYGSGAVEDLGRYTGLAQRMGSPINKGGINNDRVSDGSSQRDAGERGREGSGRLGKTAAGSEGGPVSAESGNHEGTDQSHGAIQKVTDDDSQSTKIQRRLQNAANLEMTSGRMYSIGSTDDRALMAELTDEMTAADQELSRIKDFLERRGFEVHFFKGWIGTERGSKARGSHEDGVIWIKVDDPNWTATQIALHEYMHGRIWQSDRRLFSRLFEKLRDPKYASRLNEISSRYQEALALREGSDVDKAEHILEEMMCDLYAGMNEFAAETDNAKSLRADVWADVESLDAKGTRETRAPPEEGETSFSIIDIVGEKDDYGRGVLLDTKILDPHPPRIWGKVLQDYMYQIMAGKKLTMYDAAGNPETVMLARVNDRVRADGAKRDRKVLSKLARTTGDNIRTLAIIQVSELAEASGNETYSDEHSHKWLDEHGWRFRTVYLQDRNGNIYTATLNIADGRDRLILYDINGIRKIDKAKTSSAGNVPSAVSGGASTEPDDVSAKSIAPGEASVKQTSKRGKEGAAKFSEVEDTDEKYLEAVETGDMETAQRLVDEAAEKSLKDSAIRGEDGNLMPLLHGTPEEFYIFDLKEHGGKNGTAEGHGIYLTDSPDVSEHYGSRQLHLYADIKHPAYSFKKTIKKPQLTKLIKKMCETEAERMVAEDEYGSVNEALKDTWVSNYVYTYDYSSMDRVYSDVADLLLKNNSNDSDVIQDAMMSAGIRGYDSIVDFYENILTPVTGIDGVWAKWKNDNGPDANVILAFNSSQVKSADPVTRDDDGNVIPLSQRFDLSNPDIRFSEVEEEEAGRQETTPEADLQATIRQLTEQVARLTDRLDGRETQAASTETETAAENTETETSIPAEGMETLENAGITYDAETGSVAPTGTSFSEKTWSNSEYVRGRNAAAKELAQAMGISEKKARKYIDDINSVAKLIVDDRERLDYIAAAGLSPFVSNAEYGGSFDFSTLCKKRRLFTGTFSAIQERLPNTALSPLDVLRIRKMMVDADLEAPCTMCYVEGSRAAMGTFCKKFISLYEKYHPEATWIPKMTDLDTPDGVELMRMEHPEAYAEYEKFWNNHGKLREGDKNLFASQQKPKLYMSRSAYDGEILRYFKKQADIADKNLNGGVRFQSFSDFEIANMIDVMQVIMDMSRVGLAGQAYTKVPEFAMAFGNTGLKINLSLVAKGVDADGKLIFDDVEGMPHNTAFDIRKKYSENVGTIVVTFDDAMLKAAMADDRIDFIIPFHRSQWKKSQYKAMVLPATTKDYTYQQNEKYLAQKYHEYRGKQVKTKIKPIMSKTYWEYDKDGKYNAEKYLRLCAEDGRRPVFYKLLVDNGDGSFSLQPDGSTDGYWKLLIDFKMYDNKGNGAPQLPVRPDFNMGEITRIMNEYEGGHEHYPVAHGIVDQFVKEYKQEHKGAKFSEVEDENWSRSIEETEEEYNKALAAGDEDWQKQLVFEAAVHNNYTVGAYHGSPVTDIDVFNTRSEDTGKQKKQLLFGTHFTRVISFADIYARKAKNSKGTSRLTTKKGRVYNVALDLGKSLDLETARNHQAGEELYELYQDLPAKIKRKVPTYLYTAYDEQEGLGTAGEDYVNASIIEDALQAMSPKEATDFLVEHGYNSVLYKAMYNTGYWDRNLFGADSSIIMLDPERIKSLDPVTYDDNGNVIPLHERFNKNDSRIRFSEAEEEGEISTVDELVNARKRAEQAKRYLQKTQRQMRLNPKESGLVDALMKGTLTEYELPRGVDKHGIMAVYRAKQAYREAMAPVDEYNKQRRSALDKTAEALAENSDEWKDRKSRFGYDRETARRNIQYMVKDEAEANALIRTYIDPIREHEAEKNRMVSRYNERIKRLGIETRKRRGNKVSEAYAIQYVGELEFIRDWLEQLPEGETRGDVTYQEAMTMLSEFWAENPNLDRARIQAAVAEFRSIYDEIFAMINEARVLNGYAPIDYRKGYFPHFTSNSADNIIQSLANGLGIGVEVTELPTSIAGTTHLFRPGIQWSGHMLQRTGNETDYNVLEGWDRYIPAVANIIYHTEDIQNLRALERTLRSKYSDTTLRDEIERTRTDRNLTETQRSTILDELFKRDTTQLNYFVQWLREYTNQLAGKRADLDRVAEAEAGRKLYRIVQKFENRVAANMLGGNISSAMTNFVPLFQAWGNVRSASMIRAVWDTTVGAIKHDGFRDGSDFLVNRRGYNAMYQTLFDKTKNGLFLPFNVIDDFVSETIVRARYYDELHNNPMLSPEVALANADTFAGSVLADRAVGELPVIFNSKNPFVKVFTMFQVEANNDLSHFFKDVPKDTKKKGVAAVFLAILKYVIGVHIFNDLFEALFGRRVSFDPLEMLNNLVGDITGYELPNGFELSAELIRTGEWPGWEAFESDRGDDFFGDLIGKDGDLVSWLENLPFLGTLLGGGRYPILSALPEQEQFSSGLQAFADLIKKEDEQERDDAYDLQKIYKAARAPLAYFLPPAFGGQARKIAEGLYAWSQGGSYTITTEGEKRLQYPIEGAADVIRAMTFGKTATRAGKKWVRSDFDTLSTEQTAAYIDLVTNGSSDSQKIYDILHDLKGEERDSIAKAYALASADLKDSERVRLLDALVSESQSEKFTAMMTDGDLTFRQCAEIYDKYHELSKMGELKNADDSYVYKKADLATRFAAWIDDEGYTDEQKAVITGQYKFWNMVPAEAGNYDNLTAAGVSRDHAVDLVSDWANLEVLPGKDKVTWRQKVGAVVQAGYLSETEKQRAVKALQSSDEDSEGRSRQDKYQQYIIEYGTPAEVYYDYISQTDGLTGDDLDGDGKNDAFTKIDKKLAIINRLPLQPGQKTALAIFDRENVSEKTIYNRAPWLK